MSATTTTPVLVKVRLLSKSSNLSGEDNTNDFFYENYMEGYVESEYIDAQGFYVTIYAVTSSSNDGTYIVNNLNNSPPNTKVEMWIP